MEYHVSFPGMGLNFDIHNQVSIFGLSVYWYGIIIACGLILAVLYGTLNSKRLGISADNLLNCVIVGIITGILGARAYYVIFNWDYYGANPEKIMAINEGGLAIYGGIIGALIGGLIVAKISKMNIPALLDVASIGFLIGQGIGRWGNFFNQEAFGVPTDLPWGMVSEGTGNIPVHPCFLYESVWCLLGALVIHLLSKSKFRKYHGQMALVYLVWYGAERSIVEGLRTDSLYLGGIRVSQALSVLLFLAGLVTLIVLYIKKYENLQLVLTNSQIEKVFEEDDNAEDDNNKSEDIASKIEDINDEANDDESVDDDEQDDSETFDINSVVSSNEKELDEKVDDILKKINSK